MDLNAADEIDDPLPVQHSQEETSKQIDELIKYTASKSSRKAWDASAMLSSDQQELIADLGNICSKRPWANKKWENEVVSEKTTTDDWHSGGISQLFLRLADATRDDHKDDSEELVEVHEHHKRMRAVLSLCDQILGKLDSVEGALQGLQSEHDFVVEKTSTLHVECEKLLADKVELEKLAGAIETKLQIYDELENVQRQLSQPKVDVASSSFEKVLNSIDDAVGQLSVVTISRSSSRLVSASLGRTTTSRTPAAT
mmetsp:Transcript_51807/g.161215  ORF Transcript_51807/g.161215 Transcript_51807/m.161215 type:complete len:256 (+) Transcript_51807:43-810(+)